MVAYQSSGKLRELGVWALATSIIEAGNDPLREMFAYLLNALMEAEANSKAGAEKGEHNPDRLDSRSGYRNRCLGALFGTYNLSVPEFRHQGYEPRFMAK